MGFGRGLEGFLVMRGGFVWSLWDVSGGRRSEKLLRRLQNLLRAEGWGFRVQCMRGEGADGETMSEAGHANPPSLVPYAVRFLDEFVR